MNERAMTPEEEAALNLALFQTDKIFRDRVKDVLVELLRDDGNIKNMIEYVANHRLQSFKQNLADSLSNAVRNTY